MKRLVIHPEAKAELTESISFYEFREKGRGHELRRAVSRAMEDIRRRPRTYPKHLDEVQKKVIPKFPYTIYFAETADMIFIMAIAHQHRQPDYWVERQFEP